MHRADMLEQFGAVDLAIIDQRMRVSVSSYEPRPLSDEFADFGP
jgi:hypothetical protein